jgi:hypothetical protein
MAKETKGPTEQQWGHAMSLWVTTDLSAIRIGEEIGVTEGAVRKRAKRDGWGPRNAPERKRALVAAAASGTSIGTSFVPRTETEKGILEAAQVDIDDMDLAISVGRRLLRRCSAILASCEEMTASGDPDLLVLSLKIMPPKDLASVAGTWKMAVEGIRRIRGLDAPGGDGDLTIEWGEVVGRRQ